MADLVANYSGVAGLNTGNARAYGSYAQEATRIADRSGDAEMRCGARGYLIAARLFTAETELCLAACGEIGLGGEIRRVGRIDLRLREAARLGFRRVMLPEGVGAQPPAGGAGR